MLLRCLLFAVLVVSFASSLTTPDRATIKESEHHIKEKEKDTENFEATVESGSGHGPHKPSKLPIGPHKPSKLPIVQHPIKDGMISGAVLVPLGLGYQGGHSIHQQQGSFSLEVFKTQVIQITKKIEELRTNLKLLLTKYQNRRNANMKVLITKYKSGIQRLVSDKLKIETLIKCTINPGMAGCGTNHFGANGGTSSNIFQGSYDRETTSNIQHQFAGGAHNYHPSMPYPMHYPNQMRYPQPTMPSYNAQSINWAEIAAQLSTLSRNYKSESMTNEKEKIVNGNAGVNYGTISIGATEKKIVSHDTEEIADYVDNDYNRRPSKYYGEAMDMMKYGYGMGQMGVQDYGFASQYNMGQGYGKSPLYYNADYGGRQPFVPGMNTGSYVDQGNMNLGMTSSYGKDYFNMMSGESGLTSSQLLGSFEGDTSSSLFESSLLGTENLSELDESFGIGDFESQQFEGGEEGYGPLIGVFLPGQDAPPPIGKPGEHGVFLNNEGKPWQGKPSVQSVIQTSTKPGVVEQPILPPRVGEGDKGTRPLETPAPTFEGPDGHEVIPSEVIPEGGEGDGTPDEPAASFPSKNVPDVPDGEDNAPGVDLDEEYGGAGTGGSTEEPVRLPLEEDLTADGDTNERVPEDVAGSDNTPAEGDNVEPGLATDEDIGDVGGSDNSPAEGDNV